ncbi:hypothetical protein [Streptomyces sp. RPT161]|uniref:hypothetical protein n=1 Tax=Streptomyces sp. RPT161 TaxID=3015993 RepID=UPI0022B88D80|nr:hypothetical protein [Streptomyces sp. RPT161]
MSHTENLSTSRRVSRRTLRREVPSTVALLADREDFTAMRSYSTFAFHDHAQYLRQMQGLLRSLAARGIHISVALFDPAEFAAYCADTGQDPDTAATRSRYIAEVAAGGATVPYQGQPVDHLVSQLIGAADRRATWEHATELLARASGCDACAGGGHNAAFDRASEALSRLLRAAGTGRHHLVCSVPVVRIDAGPDAMVAEESPPLAGVLRARCADDGTVQLGETDALVFCTVLAVGLATGSPGGVVLRTGRGTPGEPDRVRGWSLRDGWLHPLTEAEVFNAYCTDAETGEPVPPEPGVTYCAGTPLPPPSDA